MSDIKNPSKQVAIYIPEQAGADRYDQIRAYARILFLPMRVLLLVVWPCSNSLSESQECSCSYSCSHSCC